MAFGILLAGLSSGAEALGKNLAETQKFSDEQSLMQQRADLETEKAKVIAQYNNENAKSLAQYSHNLQTAPLSRAAGYLSEATNETPAIAPTVQAAEPTARLRPMGDEDVRNKIAAITVGTESAGNPNAVGPNIPGQGTAKGLYQVMDATNASPGYGVAPAQDTSAQERERVGRDYLNAMLDKYNGDPSKAWAAYNAGPGRLDAAIKEGGEDWLSKLPSETQNYVAKNLAQLQGSFSKAQETPIDSGAAAAITAARGQLTSVRGKTAPSDSEILKVAMRKALAANDGEGYAALQKLAAENQQISRGNFIPAGYGGVVNLDTGEVVGATREDIANKLEEGRNKRHAEDLALKGQALALRYPPPNSVPQAEKALAVQAWITNPASLRGDRAAQTNARTWAAEMGITPADVLKRSAQAKFDAAAANTAGHRAGAMAGVEEALPALADNALDLAEKLGQGKFVPVNQLMQFTEKQLSDEDLAAFKVANQALASEYQQVVARGGTNVAALNHAIEVLNGATSYPAYLAAVNQVKKEVQINTDALHRVRDRLTNSAEIAGGRPAGGATVANQFSTGGELPTGWSVKVH